MSKTILTSKKEKKEIPAIDKFSNNNVIKSISFNQEEIIKWIMKLYSPDGFDLDPTYSKGVFYRNIIPPKMRYDIAPVIDGVKQSDCRKLPLNKNSVKSIMFDPPFTVGVPKESIKTKGSSLIAKRFSSFYTVPEMYSMYYDSLKEFYRILKPNGILVFKCQDTVSGGKQYLTHIEIILQAQSLGFYTKDLFILNAQNRILAQWQKNQQHARKFHSYFIVFIKRHSTVKYGENY